MISDEFDLDEIESRLYSQVYHSTAGDTQDGGPGIMNVNVDISLENSNNASRKKYRYFKNDRSANSSPADCGNKVPCNNAPIQNNITINPSPNGMMPTKATICTTARGENLMGTEENYLGIQNNIIVNQYPVPVLFNPESNEVLNPTINNQLFSWPPEEISRILRDSKRLQRIENRRIRNSKKKRQKSRKTLRTNVLQKESDVVYILDESDSDNDCVIVQDERSSQSVTINTGFPKRYDETSNDRKPESDDDIIYIPPPPVEVINVDVDDMEARIRSNNCNTESQTESTSEIVDTSASHNILQDTSVAESSASNDFLENPNIENRTNDFNFSLHGSDFNNDNVDFVKPANPGESCETESSCSTNECNRDFNNSIKTIVFSEVEFPKEDMFSDKNLESFGNFITPTRCSSKAVKPAETESDGSSSDSDLEPLEVLNKNLSTPKRLGNNLPNLSPMNEMVVSQTVYSKSKNDSSKKVSNKRRSDVLVNQETDGNMEEGSVKKTRKKMIFKNVESNVKVMNLSEDSDVYDKDTSVSSTPKQLRNKLIQQAREEFNIARTQKKKKKKGVESNDMLDENVKRKKSKTSESDVTSEESTEPMKKKKNRVLESVQTIESDCVSEKPKKKKSANNSENKTNEVVEVTKKKKSKLVELDKNSENELVPEESKKKKKSAKNSESETNEDNIEITRKKKGKHVESGKNSENEFIPEEIMKRNSVDNSESDTNEETVEETRKKKSKLVESGKNSGNELVIEELQKKKPVDNSLRETNEETIEVTQKKKTKFVESDENLEVESAPEKSKKKKDNFESNDCVKQQKRRRSSTKSDQEMENADSVVMKEIVDIGAEDIIDVEENSIIEILQREQELTSVGKVEENAQISEADKNETALTSEESTNEVVVDILDTTQASNIDNTKDDSEDEFIVVDDIGSDFSDYAPEEKVQSIVDSSDEYIEVVLTSGGEESLGSIADNLQLANCIVNVEAPPKTEELVVVDDNSVSNVLGSPPAADKTYEEFDIDAIQSNQTDNPNSWIVSHKDRFTDLNIFRTKGPRCNKCRNYGHTAIRCTEKLDPPNCSLCGFPGHQQPRCPRKICTQCGNEGDYSTSYCWKCFKFRNSICRLCNMRGHISRTCPDLWRRYHLTTEAGPIVVSQVPQLKPRDQQWCSGCARQGHLEHECNYYNREYPPSNPCIISYEDVLLYNTRVPQTVAIPSTTPQVDEEQPQASNSQSPVLPPQNASNFIPPLMSLDLPDVATKIAEATVTSPNLVKSQVVLNPFANENTKPSFAKQSILDQMKQNFTNEDDNREQINFNPKLQKKIMKRASKKNKEKIQRVIMTSPGPIVRNYLEKEMLELENLVRQSNPRFLRKQLYKYESMCQRKVADIGQYFRIRIINMFIFGIHKCLDGSIHMNLLKRFLSDRTLIKLDMNSRKSLLSSYSYIFGMKKHGDVNYAKCINQLIRKYDEGKLYNEPS